MTKFHMVYNPYSVETNLSVKLENSWTPVSAESGLLHISKARMQRWIELENSLCNGKSYFDELFEATGERTLEIFFSGTKEDLEDLITAAENYQDANPIFKIKIWGEKNISQNDSKEKLQRLKEILIEKQNSKFRCLLPEEFWNYADEKIFNDNINPVEFVELSKWEKGFMFDPSDWQLLCAVFSFDAIQTENLRDKFCNFGECMANVANRNSERERFLLLCRCENESVVNDKNTRHVINKLLMEYGLQDLRLVLLTNEDRRISINAPEDKLNDRVKETQKIVSVFKQRYAEQYRLKKMHDVLKKILHDADYKPRKQKNIRRVETIILAAAENSNQDNLDDIIYEGYAWINELFDNLNTLLNVGNENFEEE